MEGIDIVRIAEDTWSIEDGMVRFFLLTGSEKALMIDSGISPKNGAELAKELTRLPVELLHTHADRDHIAGSGSFDWFYMHPSECVNYYHAGNKGTFRPVYDGDVIDLGGRELEVIALPGHTPGSITVLDRRSGALFGGDPIQDGNIFMFGPYREMHAYIASLQKLDKRTDFDRIYPSHGTSPVERSILGGLIAGAENILAGRSIPQKVNALGMDVNRYDVGCAAFLSDL